MTPVIKLGQSANCVITVPLDDTHTMSWGMTTGRLDQPPSTTPPPVAVAGYCPIRLIFWGAIRLKFFYETAESGNSTSASIAKCRRRAGP